MAEGGLVVAPPGWFADPVGLSDLRWWSGAEWTEHVAPSPAMHPADVPRPGTMLGSDPTSVPQPGTFVPPQPETSGYVPFGGDRTIQADPRSWAPSSTKPTRWNTAGAWALSASPFIGVLSGVGILFASSYASRAWWWALSIALLPLLWSLAAATRDRTTLETFGYDRLPSRWWLLLGPLAYLVARTVFVRRQSGRGSAPLWWYGGVTVLLIGLASAAGFLLAAGFAAALHTG